MDKERENEHDSRLVEFLMNYGWAILVVLLSIGSLAYFGVLNPANLLPDYRTIVSDDVDDCIFGCIAGTKFNGTKFNIIRTIDDDTLMSIYACEQFCTLSEQEGVI